MSDPRLWYAYATNATLEHTEEDAACAVVLVSLFVSELPALLRWKADTASRPFLRYLGCVLLRRVYTAGERPRWVPEDRQLRCIKDGYVLRAEEEHAVPERVM